MSVEETAPRTRRALLAAGAGGVLAAVAATLGRPQAARAANGDNLIMGQTNLASITTGIQGPVPALSVVGGVIAATPTTSTAEVAVQANTVYGTAVRANADTGKGVWAVTGSGTAVRVQTGTGTGVWATSTGGVGGSFSTAAIDKVAVLAQNTSGKRAAIEGFSGPGTPPAGEPESGVHGVSNVSINSIGVVGRSASGTGVFGDTTNGYGVAGLGYYGVYGSGNAGVVGDVDGGTGVVGWTGVAFAPDPAVKVGVWAGAENGRTALDVHGVARFSRSGKVSFAAGQASKTITVTGGITATSLGFAMIQSDKTGYYVRAVVPSTTGGTIKVILNKAVTTTTTVAWQVIG